MYLKGDWSYWEKTPEDMAKRGYSKEYFVCYTLRHRVRGWIGIHGLMHDGEYLFNNPPSWKYPRINKLLNRIINLIPVNRPSMPH